MGRFSATVFLVALLSALASATVPVFVMMPLDTVTNNIALNNAAQIASNLNAIKSTGAAGVMLDVWWGLVEREAPRKYNWAPYQQFVALARNAKLELRCVMSFHMCGGNVGDTCDIPLPRWVLAVGDRNPDIFYTDREGARNKEYLSAGVTNVKLFSDGRSPLDVYHDFMMSFRENVVEGNEDVFEQVQIGLGPAGELRYPSYPLSKWAFPGVGEFQAYDKYLLADLANAAAAAGHPEWGHGGPSNAGTYNSNPYDTGFFSDNGGDNYASLYGRFFLNWYSQALLRHGAAVLSQAEKVFGNMTSVSIAAKVSGVHWWYKSSSHAAELTAGYYNTNGYDAYVTIANMFAQYGVRFDFTCMEMQDSEQGNNCGCGPQELVAQTHAAANSAGVHYAGENALPRYDQTAYNTIVAAAGASNGGLGAISSFNYLRLDGTLLQPNNLNTFRGFVDSMRGL